MCVQMQSPLTHSVSGDTRFIPIIAKLFIIKCFHNMKSNGNSDLFINNSFSY